MSWLAKQIKGVLREKSDQAAALHRMMAEVEGEYDRRRGQVRVHDEAGEGILFGKRNYVTRNAQTNTMELTCSHEIFEKRREEAFSRALFNQKMLLLGKHRAFLISYEAPLLRKAVGRGGGICKLDLVALDATAIWAIEYKHRYTQSTTVRYGVLEALAYGFLLACHIRDNREKVERQVAKCIDCRGPYIGPSLTLPDTVKFAVAAPPKLYRDDTSNQRRIILTDRISKLASSYAGDGSNHLNLNLSFGGFLVIGDENTVPDWRAVQAGSSEGVTYFTPPIEQVPVFRDIKQVQDYLGKKPR